MEFIKVHKIINHNCFIGLRGNEDHIKHCTTSLRTNPYDFTQASPKLIKNGQEVVCLSPTVGWARAEILNKNGADRFQVRLLDYLSDEDGNPIIDEVIWESVKILPRRLSSEKIRELAGVFYFVDPSQISRPECQHHVLDKARLELLLRQMIECEDEMFRCVIKQPLDPLHAVVTIYLDFPLNGFLNGEIEVPYIRVNRQHRSDQREASNFLPQLEGKWKEIEVLKEAVIYEEDQNIRRAIMERIVQLLSDKPSSLEELEGSSDDDKLNAIHGSGNMPVEFNIPLQQTVVDRSFMSSASPSSSRESPYRKEKEIPSMAVSHSRKQKQAQKKKQRSKNKNILNDDSASTTSESFAGDQMPSGSSDVNDKRSKDYVPIEFLQTRFHTCLTCGYVNEDHACPYGSESGRRLQDMWGRSK